MDIVDVSLYIAAATLVGIVVAAAVLLMRRP